MSEPAVRHPDLSIQMRPDLGHINLRGRTADPEFLAAIKRVLGHELPVTANTMSLGKHRIYWLGPDEWQIVTGNELISDLVKQLRATLTGLHATVLDLSGAQLAIHLSGPQVLNVLAQGCTLDLHPGEFRQGDCAQSALAKASILIGHLDRQPVFELVVRRSYADYLTQWLAHAARDRDVAYEHNKNRTAAAAIRIPASQ